MTDPLVIHPGPLAGLASALDDHAGTVDRLWARDHRLWREDPTEISDRLGWLDVPETSGPNLAAWVALAEEAVADGITQVVVIGMGGSSLFPDVLAATFEATRLPLLVLDSTHPSAVRRVLEDLPVETTMFVVSSKSGTTLETRSHLDTIWEHRAAALDEPGRRFLAITDPGSELDDLARSRGFRAVVHADPNVGGRFSALTPFGLVPAALLGVDVRRLLDGAAARLGLERSAGESKAHAPGLGLGVFLAEGARAGRDKVTLVLDERISLFADWIEQLVAESLGKDGVSVTPIVGDDSQLAGALPGGDDRLHVVIGHHPAVDDLVASGTPVAILAMDDEYDLGALVVTFEVATAVAGAVLGVQPFDQPDVASAKSATSAVLASGLSDVEVVQLEDALAVVRPGDLVAITAFIDPGSEVVDELSLSRAALRDQLGNAVTLGIGPRYLHSTGQLHKGGADNIVVLQVVGDEVLDGAAPDVAIPGRDFGFRTLLAAQAEGDLNALRERGRRAFRVPPADLLGLA